MSILILPPALMRKTNIFFLGSPDRGKVQLNSAGAFNQTHLHAACGGLITDADGRILWAFQECIDTAPVLESELYGIWNGLFYFKDRGWVNVIADSFGASSTLPLLILPYCSKGLLSRSLFSLN